MKNQKTKKIILFIIKNHFFLLLSSFIVMLLTTAIGIYMPIIVKDAIDINISMKDTLGLAKKAELFLVLLFILSILTYLSVYLTETFGQKFLFDLKRYIFSHILHCKMKIFDSNPVGKLIARIESDGESLREFFTSSVISIISDIVLCFGMILVLFKFSPLLTLLILPVIVIIFFFSFWFQRSVAPFWVILRKINSTLYGYYSDFIKGHDILRLFNKFSWAFHKINLSFKKKFINELRGELIDAIYYNSLQIFEAISISVVLWVGLAGNISSKVSIGTIILFATYIKQFFGPIKNLSSQFQIFQRAIASIERIDDVFNMETEEINESEDREKGIQFKDRIVFSQLSFKYPIHKDDEDTGINNIYALKDVNFEINKGEKVGIVGKTGSGKTTITALLLKFYDEYEGSIKVDDKELCDIGTYQIRSLIGAVFQDTFLFPDTILNNIILDSQLTEDDVLKAIDILGLKAIFDRFPAGLQTVLKDDGSNISSGEKQIIAILRIYIRDPQIFIFDEATSSIDNNTETLIYDALKKILKDKTAIIIAHRLSTIDFCDKILCFHEGKLVESGTKQQLLLINGYFKKLYMNYKREEKFEEQNNFVYNERIIETQD